MNPRTRCLFTLLPLLAGLLLPPRAGLAAVTAVTPVYGGGNLPVNRSSVVTVRWQVQLGGGTQPVTVTSPQGDFVLPNVLLGTVGTVLSRPATIPALVTFTEQVRVPASVLHKAFKLGSASLRYQRSFSDGTTAPAVSAEVVLNLAGASGGGFSIDHLSLRFDDDSPLRLLAREEPLQARAEVSFTGTGLLKAVWEVAEPSSAMGEPVFRALRSVQQQLSASKRSRLSSPPLPTGQVGLYRLRLRIVEPAVQFQAPVIYYFVGGRADSEPLPTALDLLAPRPGGLLAATTDFHWQAVQGASAYQLEIYARPRLAAPAIGSGPITGSATHAEAPRVSGRPLTGMLVPAAQTRTALSRAVRQYLAPGHDYLWRVLAIGSDGGIIGASTARELRVP